MKFKEFIEVKTLVDKGEIKKGSIGTIIHIHDEPEGYEVEFYDKEKEEYGPWAIEAYFPQEIEIIKKSLN